MGWRPVSCRKRPAAQTPSGGLIRALGGVAAQALEKVEDRLDKVEGSCRVRQWQVRKPGVDDNQNTACVRESHATSMPAGVDRYQVPGHLSRWRLRTRYTVPPLHTRSRMISNISFVQGFTLPTVFTTCPWNAASRIVSDRCGTWNASCSPLLNCSVRTPVSPGQSRAGLRPRCLPPPVRDATFLDADRREIALRRGHHNRLGFAYQVAFVRVLGRFPQQTPLDGEILKVRGPAAGRRRRDDPRLRPPAADGLGAISSASASTCVCALSIPPPENGWRGSLRTRRCGSSGPPRCWRGRAPGSATSTFSHRPIRCCAGR